MIAKFLAEAASEERQIFLGWKLDTRQLLIRLPTNKFTAWTENPQRMIKTKRTTYNELDTNIGRLTHLSVILQPILHFISRICFLKDCSKSRREIIIPGPVLDDIKLFIQMLELAHNEINMNLITYRARTHLYRSDACPAGISGYSHLGRAWRFQIPKELCCLATLNFLERIACEIGPWIDIHKGNLLQYLCILSMTDSTTAAGWLRKSNCQEVDENEIQIRLKREVSRAHALRMMKNNIKTYSQWFQYNNNEFLDDIPALAKTCILSCFAQVKQQANFSASSYTRLAAGTVRSTMDDVAKTFRDYGRPDPRLDCDGKTAQVLLK